MNNIMDKTTFYARLAEIEREERSYQEKILDMKRQLLSDLPFKVGDMVSIRNEGTGWIKSISVSTYGLDVELYRKNKEGKRSKRYTCAWSVRIEDIKHEQVI